MNKNRTSVYIRKSAQKTLQKLSEMSRLSQSQILAEWLESLEVVLGRCGDVSRISLATYPSNTHKMASTMIAPIIEGGFDIPVQTSDSDANLLVRTDLELKASKVGIEKKKKRE